jgi:hypothetical protein
MGGIMNKHWRLGCIVMTAVLAAGAVACGDDGDDAPAAEIPVVDITKTDDAFEAPNSTPGGLTRVRFHNASTQQHAVTLVRFTGDGTMQQFLDAIEIGYTDWPASTAAILRLIEGEGGAGFLAPGSTVEVVLDLEPGRYVIVRFPFRPPLTRPLEVTAAPEAQPAPPKSAFTVGMVEFAYEGFPDTLPAGKTTVEVVNQGEQLHLMDVQRVNEAGITAEQVRQHLSGTPQPVAPTYSAAGGMGELAPGGAGWVTLDLEPGVYNLSCLIFDRAGGTDKLHLDLGMHHAFTVE